METLTDTLRNPVFFLPALLLVAAGLLAWVVAQGRLRRPTPRSPIPGRRPRPAPTPISGRPAFSFDDVAGVDEAVEELREVRDYLLNPQRFRQLGAELPRGILLHGPPGTGKTLLAKALAGETQAAFYPLSGSSFDEVYVGLGAARIRELFQQAANEAPAIIFIDEVDAIGRRRATVTTAGQDERDATLNQLLAAIDGFDSAAGVVLIAATNRPEVLDPALLRPGRFDRRVPVDRPDRAGRRRILAVHARGKQLSPAVDLDDIAQRTAGLSGADLAGILNEAALLAGRQATTHIQPDHVHEAIDRVLLGPARTSHVLDPDTRCRIAYHEAGHATAAVALPDADLVRRITLVPRGSSAGHTSYLSARSETLLTRSQLLARIVVLLAGQAAEELVFGEPSTGAADDLQRAMDLAERMVTRYGMTSHPDHLAACHQQTATPNNPPDIPTQVRAILDTCRHGAQQLLADHTLVLDAVAEALLEHETLDGDQLAGLLRSASPEHHTADRHRAEGRIAKNSAPHPPAEDRRPRSPSSPTLPQAGVHSAS